MFAKGLVHGASSASKRALPLRPKQKQRRRLQQQQQQQQEYHQAHKYQQQQKQKQQRKLQGLVSSFGYTLPFPFLCPLSFPRSPSFVCFSFRFRASSTQSGSSTRLWCSAPEGKDEGSSFLDSESRISSRTQSAVGRASTSLVDQISTVELASEKSMDMGKSKMDARSESCIRETIEVTEREETIFSVLMETIQFFNLNTQLRVAGGWVRDKLLGKECYDIDIALDDMLGKEFAEKVNEYLKHRGEHEVTIGVIQSNPEQSKHLETATMNIHGFLIDLVNLRSETYADHSRIPIMKFGSPLEDALRRDLTINSLFYNINNRKVEDFTGKGLEDLRNGIIRTPLPALQTFLDDPLRVLRAIRFGARFGFTLDDDIIQSSKNEQVIQMLATKISRERIGKEIDLMLHGKNPLIAIYHLYSSNLFSSIFSLPKVVTPTIDFEYEKACLNSLEQTLFIIKDYAIDSGSESGEGIFTCLFSALLFPLKDFSFYEKKNKLAPLSVYIVRDSLKLKNTYAENIVTLHKAAVELQIIGDSYFFSETENKQNARVAAGRALISAKALWKYALPLAALHSIKEKNSSLVDQEPNGINSNNESNPDDRTHMKRKRTVNHYSGSEWCEIVEKSILELGLDGIWEMKPLLTGKEIMTILSIKGGPLIGEYVDKVRDWRLANPQKTKQECETWLRSFL